MYAQFNTDSYHFITELSLDYNVVTIRAMETNRPIILFCLTYLLHYSFRSQIRVDFERSLLVTNSKLFLSIFSWHSIARSDLCKRK